MTLNSLSLRQRSELTASKGATSGLLDDSITFLELDACDLVRVILRKEASMWGLRVWGLGLNIRTMRDHLC